LVSLHCSFLLETIWTVPEEYSAVFVICQYHMTEIYRFLSFSIRPAGGAALLINFVICY
jgi:hypothetical protein